MPSSPSRRAARATGPPVPRAARPAVARVAVTALALALTFAGCPGGDGRSGADAGGSDTVAPPPVEVTRRVVPDDRIVLYQAHAQNDDPLHPNVDPLRLVVDRRGHAHVLEEGLLTSDGVPWYVQALGWNAPGPQDAGLPPVAVVGFDLTPDDQLAIGITPLSVSPSGGPSGGVVRLDGATRTYVDFVPTGELLHQSGLERTYMPLAGSHVTSRGVMRVDLVGGPFPWADGDNYAVPFTMNEAPVPPGGLYSAFTDDKLYRRFVQYVDTPEGSKLYQGTVIVRVPVDEGPDDLHCACVDVVDDRCVLNAYSTRCFSFPHAVAAAAMGDDGIFYVAEAGSGDVWGHALDDPDNAWHEVATGFQPTAVGEPVQDLFFAQDGSRVLFVMAQDGVYAFHPSLSRTLERSAEPAPVVTEAVTAVATPCVAGAPCISAPAILVVSGTTCVGGTGFGFAPGLVHLDADVFEDRQGWNDTNVCFQVDDTRRPDATLWVELPDGRRSNRTVAVMPVHVDALTPAVVRAGDTFTLTGSHFGRPWPVGHTWFGGATARVPPFFRVTRWSDTEIVGQVLASVGSEFAPVITRIVADPLTHGLGPAPVTAGPVPVEPTLFSGCAASPGVTCRIHVAGGVTTVRVNGAEVPVSPTNLGWIDVVVPDLPPGDYPLEVENAMGRTASGTLTVLGWTRHAHAALSRGGVYGAPTWGGAMHGIPSGGVWVVSQSESFALADDGTWYVNGLSLGFTGYGALAAPARTSQPFTRVNASFGGSGRRWDFRCGRPRVATDGIRVFGAGRMSTLPNQVPEEQQVPGCDGRFPYLVEAGSGDAPGDEIRVADAQEALFPAPGGELGGVSGLVSTETATFLAVRNDTDRQTELYRFAFGGPFVQEAILPGRGALLRAGEYAFLAGGAPGDDGAIHELFMDEEQVGEPRVFRLRTVPPIAQALPLERQPLFAGADDGALYAGWIDDAGALRVSRFPGGGDAWVEVASVPSGAVPGVPEPATLLADPTRLEIVDLGVLDGRVYLLSQHDDGERVRLEVYHQRASGWARTHEELASWWPHTHPCVGPWDDPNVYCGIASGTRGCRADACAGETDAWTPRPGSASRAHLNASHGELWVLYEVRYDDPDFNGFLGDDRVMIAKLAAPPVVPD